MTHIGIHNKHTQHNMKHKYNKTQINSIHINTHTNIHTLHTQNRDKTKHNNAIHIYNKSIGISPNIHHATHNQTNITNNSGTEILI